MENFFKIPVNFEENKNITVKPIDKDILVGEVDFKDMLSPLIFTKDNLLFNDPAFLAIQLVANLNSYPILNYLNPELIPLLYDENTINKFKGTPLFYFIKGHLNQVEDKIKKSVKNVENFDKMFQIFLIFYSIIISKGLILNLNNKPTLCLFPILNKLKFSSDPNIINCKLEIKDNKLQVISTKDIPSNSKLYIPYNLTPSFEYNFIKYGILPDSFSDTTINISFKDYKIVLAKNMKDDDKIMLRRIRKNPKYKDLKSDLQKIFKEKINELENNKTEDKIIKEYINHVLKLYKNNYPK
jgi:hypothetical protein